MKILLKVYVWKLSLIFDNCDIFMFVNINSASIKFDYK